MRPARLLLPAVLLVLAAAAGVLVDRARREAGIRPSPARVPLGGFEPLVVDLLYLRASSLLTQRRLPEALATIRVVTELQPRVADGWEFLGTTLAWNVSDSSGDPREQWRWTRDGLSVLDRGLEMNPGEEGLLFTKGVLLLERICLDAAIREIAEREMGRPPEEAARETFRLLLERDPSPAAKAGFGESARLLGHRLEMRGDREGARRAYEEALPIFADFGRNAGGEKARETAEEIRRKLGNLGG